MNSNVKTKLAKNLKKYRKQKQVTQEALSLELDFDISYIGKIENAKLNVSLDRMIKIADYFGVPFVKLFD